MKIIQFGSENGSSRAGDFIWPYQAKLNDIFFNDGSAVTYFKNLDGLSIIFRVSGKNKTFKGSGAERLQKSRGRKFITIDFVIPEVQWQDKSTSDFVCYLSEGIKVCFDKLSVAAYKLGEILDTGKLDQEFQEGMKLFKETFVKE